MNQKSKTIKVMITGNAKDEFELLNQKVGEELLKNIESSDHQTLFNAIQNKIELLKANPQYGIHIQKNKIPKKYLKEYDTNNLWKVNLSGAWRMIYTIRGNEVEIISLILDIMNHRDYEKVFKYKKS